MITNYQRLLQLDAEERDIIHSAIEGAIADAITLCDDVYYIETLRAFLKFLEEMREI